MTNKLAPIVLFVYNRLYHTQKTVEALKNNELANQSELFIYSDAAKNEEDFKKVGKVRDYINEISGFKKVTIVERKENWGLASNIIDGVTNIVNSYGRVIVLEDDLVTSPYFLKYMNEALEFYQYNKKVMSVSAYNHPQSLMKIPKHYTEQVYFNYRNLSWGWGTWSDRWNIVDWNINDNHTFLRSNKLQIQFNRGGDDMSKMLIKQMKGEIDSWAIRFSYAHFKHDAYSVCPIYSYVQNIGHDSSGQHCGSTNKFFNDLSQAPKHINFPVETFIDSELMAEFRKVYKKDILDYIIIGLKKLALLINHS